jgi:hypothetical protein
MPLAFERVISRQGLEWKTNYPCQLMFRLFKHWGVTGPLPLLHQIGALPTKQPPGGSLTFKNHFVFRLCYLRGFSRSRVTSSARLSVRSPRYTGWRISPELVHSVNFTSATSDGLTQVVTA